ncbi:ectoine hydrolase DoeA [Siminovitchia terrae]|uniref:Ectoine hydrolase DoeA n=1 Tax=Siminovitchia terrae TaxID=1914933 RepID=A0A429XDT5_SIMTE|nr:M24 family metallopeptidase [Siminovitchia terrae]RST61539.1 M24 family metallopeptidase [Siminovitchia terrae]GIN90522.1 ectoine hydrolase DoeA [Siminovitchia terrae]GIN97315.1 ectoine hydrolase DoeA [Siminovitchia terrae]
MLPFSYEEYQHRLEQTKKKMLEKGIEVLLITNPANMNYLSGYNGWSFYVDQLLVIIIDEEQPIWIGRHMDANGARATTWLFDERIIPYPESYVHSEKHPMEFVADILHEIGLSSRRIGLEMESYYFSALAYEKLKQSLPNATFKDASLLVNHVRLIKSDQEIEYIKRAAKIVEKGIDAAVENIAAGVRECDVVAEIYRNLVSGTPEFGGDYPSIVPMLPSGENTSTPHLTWTDRQYKYGEMVIIELAGCHQRYHSPLARTVSIGQPSEEAYNVSQIVVEGLNTALEAVKPGVTCEEVERTWNNVIKKYGIEKESRLGYSMGLNYPPDWGEHTASIRRGDLTVLEPNMTFHMIPGLWFDDYGIEISESFRVTETGCEVLADYRRELIIKEDLDLTIIS